MAIFTEVHQPKKLKPTELDNYLSRGWFRMGQSIFTCHFLYFDSVLYSAIWIRLNLENYKFSKSLRKILRRNNARFKTIIRRGRIDEEKETLYQKHKQRFEGYIANTLKESLQEGKKHNLYDTYEVCVFDGEQLVAASFFDVGGNSVASIMGLFDPSYGKYSLGFYTMLAEIVYCMNEEKKYYYPGYVVPGYAAFDYKLRIGAVDYFCPYEKIWKAYNTLTEDEMLSIKLKNKLAGMETILANAGIGAKQMLYPLYDKQIAGYKQHTFLKSPMFIWCYPEKRRNHDLIVEYDLFNDTFIVNRVIRFEDASGFIYSIFEGYSQEDTCYDFLYLANKLVETQDPKELVEIIQKNTIK